jgi:hypothetical protein
MPDITIQKISYGGWANCVRLTNGIIDLIVSVDVGPRIIRYGFVDQKNEFCEVKAEMGLTGGSDWRIYGGHRLWHSPESRPRTYEPDNSPVLWDKIKQGIRTVQDIDPLSRIKKEMEITLSSGNTLVNVLHRLTNTGPWPVELSVWAITAMATGGKEVIPQNTRDTGLLPNRIISLWPYTRLNDPRVSWGERYITVYQDTKITHPFKLGVPNENGWAAYFNNNHLFVKYHSHNTDAEYPDFGASYETYINDFMLEMESLSPISELKPGRYAEHKELWELFDGVACPSEDENETERTLSGRVKQI